MRKEKVFSVSVEGVTSVQQMTVDVLCCPMRREMLQSGNFGYSLQQQVAEGAT